MGPGSPDGPPLAPADLVVFAQRSDAAVDVDAWNAHAVRFFATRLGLAEVPARAGAAPRATVLVAPLVAELRFVIAPPSGGGAAGIRRAAARPRQAEDLALAEAADARAGGTGLALLARRCGMVWLVSREPGEGDGIREADALALRLAVVLSSVLLGPVLDPDAGTLFGAATGRRMLESLG